VLYLLSRYTYQKIIPPLVGEGDKGGEVEMKLPNWLKIIWWLLLLGFFAYLLSQRYDSIMSGATSATDIVIFLIFIALLSIPLFQEVNFFGVQLKREIDNLRTEFKEQIVNLRSDIQNTINMRTEISPQIQFLTPPTDSELQDIKRDLKSTLEQIKEKGLEKPTPEFEVPGDNRFLFEVRYTIENELRRIWKQWQANTREWRLWSMPWSEQAAAELERPQSVVRIIRSLSELGIITPELSSVIREVYRTCSPAIHGEKVSQTAVGFVRDVAPGLITSLEATEPTFKPKHKAEE
jgi:hypothetical protein